MTEDKGKNNKKYPRIKVLVVHPSKWVRDRMANYIKQNFGCKVTTTTNYDRAISKIEKAAHTGGPASSFHVVVSAYDISSPCSGKNKQGPKLVEWIKNNPLTQKISVILEKENADVKDVQADAFVPSLDHMENWT